MDSRRSEAIFGDLSAPDAGGQSSNGPSLLDGFAGATMNSIGREYMSRNLAKFSIGFISLEPAKVYFNVSHSYVLNKLRLLFFPFRHRSWARRPMELDGSFQGGYGGMDPTNRMGDIAPGSRTVFLPPRDDINAPDLYLPLMAFVTYVVLTAFVMGTRFHFTPELITRTATTGVIAVGLEVPLMKLSLYLLSCPQPAPILDLIAYSGYKYVGVVVNVLFGLFFGRVGYNLAVAATSLLIATFIVKTFRTLFFFDLHGRAPPSQERLKHGFLLGLGAIQWPICWFLGPSLSRF